MSLELAGFVEEGREKEMARLRLRLKGTLSGEPHLALVTGDAGVGKTALLREFCRQAQETSPTLVVAWGQCSTQLGMSDPYLPFKEVLALLTGTTDRVFTQHVLTRQNESRLRRLAGHTGEAVVELGPDLVGTFLPGAGLVLRLSAFLAKKVGWLKPLEKLVERPMPREKLRPEHLFEQFSRVIAEIATQAPLVLVLEDLHWADAGTLDLLFYLARKMRTVQNSSLLIVGSYRPIEVKLGREGVSHPLERVINEVRRYWGDVVIDLSTTVGGKNGRAFVEAFLDEQASSLAEGFREWLFQRTEGHPLFTVELLRALQERGILVQDEEGQWYQTNKISLDNLPDRIEAVFDERIGRLPAELKDILVCGSVEGELFTAEAVAEVVEMAKLTLARRLDEDLGRRHRIVHNPVTSRAGKQTVHLYRFRHALFQQYLYDALGAFERRQLHGAMGRALEELYGRDTDEIASELARHFDLSRDISKSVAYYHRAAERAQHLFANEDALRLYNRALEIVADSEWRLRFELLMGCWEIYHLQGNRDDEFACLECILGLAQRLDDNALLARAYEKLAKYYIASCCFEEAINVINKALDAARQSESSPELLGECTATLGLAARWCGDLDTALRAAEEALEIAQLTGDKSGEADGLTYLSLINLDLGRFVEACDDLEKALEIYQTLGDRLGESNARYLLSYVTYGQGDYAAARFNAEQSLEIARRVGNRSHEAESLNSLGIYRLDLGDYKGAVAQCQSALAIYREIGNRRGEALSLLNIGLALSEDGEYDAALRSLREALKVGRSIHGLRTEAYALTYLGLTLEGLGNASDATEAYTKAVQLRRGMGQETLAIDGVAGLARCALAEGELSLALKYVEEVLAWISEKGVEGIEYPLRVLCTCIEVLVTTGEQQRGQDYLADAHSLLMKRASQIKDPRLRQSFLKHVSFNRRIEEMWQEAIHSSEAPEAAGANESPA